MNQSSSEMPEQPKSELIEKLNYIIDILEEQQDYKTNSIFEDLILYAFLGIFVIFIVDSFSRSGKYVRWYVRWYVRLNIWDVREAWD